MRILERYGTVLRCYDNGGATLDRYTILPPRWAKEYRDPYARGAFRGVAADKDPSQPLGYGQATVATPGPHLGRRITWGELPVPVREFASSRFPEFADAAREWVAFCRRTEDPKLSFIERQLDARRIPHRRNGESWHGPILQVPKEYEDDAWSMLALPARKFFSLPVRHGVTLDDVPDDHPAFREGML